MSLKCSLRLLYALYILFHMEIIPIHHLSNWLKQSD